MAAGAAGVWGLQRQVLHGVPAFAALEIVDYTKLPGVWFAALAGFFGELAELPNSFVKRQLGIPPGGTARGPLAAVFYLWDQLDVLSGYGLVVACVVPPTPLRVAVSVTAVAAIHPLVAWVGSLLRMRPTAR